MHVKRKALFVAAVLIAGLFSLYACTSSSTSVSGQLSIVTFEGSGDVREPLEDIPFSNLKLADLPVSGLSLGEKAPSHSPDTEFVPDEIIIQYRPGVEPFAVQGLTLMGGYRNLRTSRDVAAGVVSVLKLTHVESARLSVDALRDRTLREIERLNALPDVDFAQPNYIYKPFVLPNLPDDKHYGLQWHYPLIKLDHLWSESLVSNLEDVTVAVIDTGIARKHGTKTPVEENHEDFGGSGLSPFIDEYDFISSASRSLDEDGYDDDATDPGDNPDPYLASFHGTHVIGTIGAYTGNSTGVAGVAGGLAGSSVKIMPLRALGYGGGTTADIVDAIKYAARIPNSTDRLPSAPADIINMSLGSTADDPLLRNAVDAAFLKGILIVAAAGNDGTPTTFYPAGYDSVISVSAVDIGAEITQYSNYGSTIDIAAPGGNFSFDLNFDTYVDGILSTFSEIEITGSYSTKLYAFYQGTSMAAPHVAGVAALIKATNPGLSPHDVQSRIEATAIDLGAAGRDNYYGHGLINAYAAVKNGAGMSPILFPFPKQIKLMGDNPSDTLILKNIGDTSDISFSSSTQYDTDSPGNWLTITPDSGTVNAVGTEIAVSVDTGSYPTLQDGKTYTALVTFPWGATQEDVYVLYKVSGFPKTGIYDIGLVYVVAIDIEAIETSLVRYYDVTDINNMYAYRIGGLPSGSYVIAASTDHNGDGIIFESEDFYGFYISIDQIVSVELGAGQKLSNIDFDVVDQYTNPDN